MPDGSVRVLALELGLVLLALACQPVRGDERGPDRRAPAPSAGVAPRPASTFEPRADGFVQRHPRLPDSGEWRCAERAGVVWCAGGQAPAGVALGLADARFRCGERWGTKGGERVCIDPAPDYPEGGERDCRFEQERGIERRCKLGAPSTPSSPLPARVVPACWLDRDCGRPGCDRGACRCQVDSDCQVGRCQAGHCVEGVR